ncbi:uncharacterized protein A1O5_07288 [Cladophialophora psammophila CBS 110553]|uniref:DUF1446 domain-containing protein n=1 Tax=Cladophialophora psammophila CBS 110553 TaxID=1182543 RepID=W9WM52_9EURO|nr:uncharacterized protein A1O5_07288 [Cladophialophora psammophila CBS 110553]EXJ69252.1 hypothetical protein A1O5_07288 [Cladophialophora psammophila CBS 110553]
MTFSAGRKAEGRFARFSSLFATTNNISVSVDSGRLTKPAGRAGFEPTFLEALEPALPHIAKHGIKVVVNAGVSDTRLLHTTVVSLLKEKGLSLKVAWIEGDEVLDAINELRVSKKARFENICTQEILDDWKFEPLYAQCYLGPFGIAAALSAGADIVLCGRVSDASLIMGSAIWWHGWKNADYDQLANSLVAGHLIECSTYITGGCFSGFKSLRGAWNDLGFPIAEISSAGEVIITKQKATGGIISVDTCTAQLLYEIQGPRYYNSDVTAIIDEVTFKQIGPDRVALSGVKSDLPPPTTKVGITANGGFQAEVHYALVGLDIEAKAEMLEDQIRTCMGDRVKDLTVLDFKIIGRVPEDPDDQSAATVDFRIVAQALKEEALSEVNFMRPCVDPIIESYPGATFYPDFRTTLPRPIFEYYVTLLPQSSVRQIAHLHDGKSVEISPPAKTKEYSKFQPSNEMTSGIASVSSYGNTTRAPLGSIVHARSGDKGSNANVGFWVRHDDEYDWLRALLSTEKIKKLLGKEYKGGKIDRFEVPNVRGVHFLLHNHLDRGVSCSKTLDILGKNVSEFLRCRWVDVPDKFLERGRI